MLVGVGVSVGSGVNVGVKDGVGVGVGLGVAVGARVGVLVSVAVLVRVGALTAGAGEAVPLGAAGWPAEGPEQAERSKGNNTRMKIGVFLVIALLRL